MFSPDGKWLAYTSNESGRPEISVRGLNGEGRWQVSTEGGLDPRWSTKRNELFYRWGGKVFSIILSGDSKVAVGRPEFLFEAKDIDLYDVMADSQHFLVDRFTDTSLSTSEVEVVLGWVDALKQRGPAN